MHTPVRLGIYWRTTVKSIFYQSIAFARAFIFSIFYEIIQACSKILSIIPISVTYRFKNYEICQELNFENTQQTDSLLYSVAHLYGYYTLYISLEAYNFNLIMPILQQNLCNFIIITGVRLYVYLFHLNVHICTTVAKPGNLYQVCLTIPVIQSKSQHNNFYIYICYIHIVYNTKNIYYIFRVILIVIRRVPNRVHSNE